jgi:putative flavoprotein involved in K+ transport
MQFVDTLIIGAGQAGLAASRLLTDASHDHVLLERGHVGERWLSSSWDSLRLLTPNWMTRLPHWAYSGVQPDGYMTAGEVAVFLDAYRRSFDAPVETHTTVKRLHRHGDGFELATNRGSWHATNVVIATGWSDQPAIPAIASRLHPGVEQLAPANYRHPDQLAAGGVLVVGASASGVQLADELRRAGREVYLAVGSHTRMLRRYRGRDIFWWLEQIGALDRSVDQMRSLAEAQHEPSLQLSGRTTSGEVDLATLAANGVTLTGRLESVDRMSVRFADDLGSNIAQADRRLGHLLDRIDGHITTHALSGDVLPREYLPPTPAIAALPALDLRDAGVSTVVWATGHRRSYPWLQLPGVVADGELVHQYGITPVPGLYVLGQRFQRTRRSNFLDGVGADAMVVIRHLLARGRSRLFVAA